MQKHSSLMGLVVGDEGKKFYNILTRFPASLFPVSSSVVFNFRDLRKMKTDMTTTLLVSTV